MVYICCFLGKSWVMLWLQAVSCFGLLCFTPAFRTNLFSPRLRSLPLLVLNRYSTHHFLHAAHKASGPELKQSQLSFLSQPKTCPEKHPRTHTISPRASYKSYFSLAFPCLLCSSNMLHILLYTLEFTTFFLCFLKEHVLHCVNRRVWVVGGFFKLTMTLKQWKSTQKENPGFRKNCHCCSVALLPAGTVFSCLFLSK